MPADRKATDEAKNAAEKSWRLERRDITETLKILGLFWIAWMVPVRFWHNVGLAFASLSARLRPRSFKERCQHIADILGGSELVTSPLEIELARIAGEYEDRLAILRSYRPGGWRPAVCLSGTEHVDAGLARGRGVVLWVNDCAGSRLFTKMAFHQAGYGVSHLSAPSHGFVGSEFGKRRLNRIWTAVEDRFLAERVRLERKNSRPALETLNRKLRENEVISITVGPWARRAIQLPFFARHLQLATGAIAMAIANDAVLLPVFVVRQQDGSTVVSVGAPLDTSGDGDDAVLKAGKGLVGLLRTYVARHPDQWRGWQMKGQVK